MHLPLQRVLQVSFFSPGGNGFFLCARGSTCRSWEAGVGTQLGSGRRYTEVHLGTPRYIHRYNISPGGDEPVLKPKR
jgi:hypothetical protein